MPLVRYWAAARELAGTACERVEGTSLDTVLAAVGDLHGPRMTALVGRCVVLVDGVQVRSDVPVSAAAQIELLPPYAGGSS